MTYVGPRTNAYRIIADQPPLFRMHFLGPRNHIAGGSNRRAKAFRGCGHRLAGVGRGPCGTQPVRHGIHGIFADQQFFDCLGVIGRLADEAGRQLLQSIRL